VIAIVTYDAGPWMTVVWFISQAVLGLFAGFGMSAWLFGGRRTNQRINELELELMKVKFEIDVNRMGHGLDPAFYKDIEFVDETQPLGPDDDPNWKPQ
jgi:hypothetical protein